MTVAELVKNLQAQDQDAVVYITTYLTDPADIASIKAFPGSPAQVLLEADAQ